MTEVSTDKRVIVYLSLRAGNMYTQGPTNLSIDHDMIYPFVSLVLWSEMMDGRNGCGLPRLPPKAPSAPLKGRDSRSLFLMLYCNANTSQLSSL